MRAYFRSAMLFAALLAILPVLAQDASDADKAEEAKMKAIIYKEIARNGKFTCKLTGLPEDAEAPELNFQVEVEGKKLNPEGIRKYNENLPRVQREYGAARARRNREAMAKALDEFNALKAGTYDVVSLTLKLGFAGEAKKDDKEEKGKGEKKSAPKTAGKDAPKQLIIRREALPPKDPENPKVKYTADELKKLKGPGAYIGYAATLKDLENGMTVVVHVDRTKWKPPMAPKKKKGQEEPAEEEDKPLPITMIVIPKPAAESTGSTVGNPLLAK